MRRVLDTNVLLSALAFPGSKPDQVLQRVRRGEVELFLSSFIVTELERILRDKFRFTKRQTDERVAVIRRMATLVEPTERIALPPRTTTTASWSAPSPRARTIL